MLVHVCCADCALKLLDRIDLPKAEIELFFLNPNIHPESEYLARLKAVQQVIKPLGYHLTVPNWRPKQYFAQIKSFTKPSRCMACWQLRLSQTAAYAKDNGHKSFTSTLLTSIYQDQSKIDALADQIAKDNGLTVFYPEHINNQLHTAGFYKQNYCGCVYSLKERLEEKFLSI